MIAALEQRIAALAGAERRAGEAEQRIAALEGECARSQRLPADGAPRAQRVHASGEELAQAVSRCRELERELAKTKRECEGAERVLQSLLDQIASRTRSSRCSTKPTLRALSLMLGLSPQAKR